MSEKTKEMVDYRCPCCDGILMGDHEVKHAEKVPPSLIKCRHCEMSVHLTKAHPDDDLVDWYYV